MSHRLYLHCNSISMARGEEEQHQSFLLTASPLQEDGQCRKDGQQCEVQQREGHEVASLRSALATEVEFQRDQRGKRCHRGSEPSDVGTDEYPLGPCCEGGEQNRGRHVADDLADQCGCRYRVLLHRARENGADCWYALHVTAEDEEAHECQQEDVVYAGKYPPVEDDKVGKLGEEEDSPVEHLEDGQQGQEEEREVDACSSAVDGCVFLVSVLVERSLL